MPPRHSGFWAAAVLFLGASLAWALEPSDEAFFEAKIRPLLIENCYECHSAESGKTKGGLRLDSQQGWVRGGDSGPAIAPNNPDASLLFKAINYRDPDLQMPPDGKLSVDSIALLRHWIVQGAPGPREEPPQEGSGIEGPVLPTGESDHWAFQTVIDPEIPLNANSTWAAEPLDRFILAQLESNSLSPRAPADPSPWLRRVTYALTGLPPKLEEMDAFRKDASPNRRSRVTDRLLASPRYGERWGRHWLDVARYSDSNGMDENKTYAQAYRYRDYVIDAFNNDLPFDAFIVQQLAGDLLGSDTAAEKIATGFLAVGPKMLACDDPQKMRMDIVDEQIDTLGRAFMGMTFGCARCHDHKFDPISIGDYYSLAGILKSTETIVNYSVVAVWHEYDLSSSEVTEAHRRLAGMKERRKKGKDSLRDTEKANLNSQIEALETSLPPKNLVMGVTENEIVDAKVHLRGNYLTLGETRRRQIPAVFAKSCNAQPMSKEGSGRLELARWISAKEHPLTRRVIANRLWRWHTGEGLVSSVDNFGVLGDQPTHPELLDYLAGRLHDYGWSIKRVHKMLLNASTFQMSSAYDSRAAAADPDNRHYWRWNRRRLDAEAIRDSLLAVSGSIDLTMHGQLLKDPAGSYVNRDRLDAYLETPRRSVYMPVIRSAVYESFTAFDFADPSMLNGDRRESVVAPQSLYLLNSPQVHRAAKLAAASESVEVTSLYRTVLGRVPTEAEKERATAYLATYEKRNRGLEALCRVLFASNAFLYLD